MIGRITPRKLNADSDDRSLSADEMKMAVNISVDSDTEGDGGIVKFSDGNTSILPSDALSGVEEGVNTVIGSVSDEELSVVYFFVHNSLNNHGIYAYSSITNTYRKIFSSPTLDFDENGFVKGDIVRIKRPYELEPAEQILNQGGQGGVDTDGGDDGPQDPVGELNPLEIPFEVGRDLYPILELSSESYRLGGFGGGGYSLTSALSGLNFEVRISGTYSEATSGDLINRQTDLPIEFYESGDLDLNLSPETTQEVVISVNPELTPDGRSVMLKSSGSVFIDPDVTQSGTYEFTVSIVCTDPIQTLGGNFAYTGDQDGYQLNLSETVLFVGNPQTLSSTNADDDFLPTINVPTKNRDQLTVGDIYGTNFFSQEQLDGGNAIVSGQKFLNSKYFPEGGGQEEPFVREEEDIMSLKLWQRTVPVKMSFDHSQNPGYIEFVELWEEQSNANDNSGEYDVEPPSSNTSQRGSRVTEEEALCNVWFYQFCADTMSYNILGTGSSLDQVDPQTGNYRTWDQLVSLALTDYSTYGYTPSAGFADNYLNYNAVISAIQGIGEDGLSQFYQEGDATIANWIAVSVSGGEGCEVADLEDIFSPAIIVAPVDQDDISAYTEPRIVTPANSYDSIEQMISAGGVFTYVFDVPVSFLSEATGFHKDVLVFQYNSSNFDAFRSIEDLNSDSISSTARIVSSSLDYPSEDTDVEQVNWNKVETINESWTDEDLTLSYPIGNIGQPNELTGQNRKGRRVRISATNGKGGMEYLNDDGATHYDSGFGFTKTFNGISISDHTEPNSFGNLFSRDFCYNAYTSCESERLAPSVRSLYTAPPPVISEGPGDVQGPTTVDRPSTTTVKDVAPELDTPAPAPSSESTKTKKTIKKKY